VASSDFVAMFKPSADMRDGEPHHEFGEFAVLAWPKQQVPVIVHHAKSQHTHGRGLQRIDEAELKRLEIFLGAEEFHFSHAAIEYVVDESAGCNSSDSGHGLILQCCDKTGK